MGETLMESQTLPLSAAPQGRPLSLVRVEGGHGFRRRLAELGMTPGTPIKVLRNELNSPLVVELRGSRLMLGRGVADRILVSLT